jgi:predicted O-methyltransferase YrrM
MSFKNKILKVVSENNHNLKSREEFPILIKQMGYKKLCEVGVNKGYFFFILALSDPDHLVGVDVWDKYDEEAYSHHPDHYHKIYPHDENKILRKLAQSWAEETYLKADIIVNFSVEAAKQFEDDYFDFVYIDANHTYEGVIADLEAWYPKVRKGGMVAGHDYMNYSWDGGKTMMCCKDGINYFLKKYGREKDFILTMEKRHKSFYFIK